MVFVDEFPIAIGSFDYRFGKQSGCSGWIEINRSPGHRIALLIEYPTGDDSVIVGSHIDIPDEDKNYNSPDYDHVSAG
jgi:hypothetical protein